MKNIVSLSLKLFLLGFFLMTTQLQAQKRNITINELPKTAQTFLMQNFKQNTVDQIIEEKERGRIDEYKVTYANGWEVEFDAKGNWKEVDGNHKAIPDAFILSAMKEYITKNYPQTSITKIQKKRNRYEIDLSNNIELIFNGSGKFLRID